VKSSLRGIVMIVTAVGLFTAMGGLIKAIPRVPVGEAVFFRSAFALPVIVLWLSVRREFRVGIRMTHRRLHLLRGILGTAAMALNFLGLRYLPMPEVTALRFVTPILVLVFAALFLGERFRLVRLGAVFTGLCGVLIILWPRLFADDGGTEQIRLLGVMIVLTSAAITALGQITLKHMAATESPAAIVFWYSLMAMFLGLVTLPLGWVWPSPRETVFLIGAGLLGGAGQMLLSASYRYADAGALAPFTYATMIWALLIGYFAFGETPTIPMMSGALLIIIAGLIIAARERQKKQRES